MKIAIFFSLEYKLKVLNTENNIQLSFIVSENTFIVIIKYQLVFIGYTKIQKNQGIFL